MMRIFLTSLILMMAPRVTTVPALLKGAPTIQKLFFGNLVRLLIKSGYNSRNIFWTYSYCEHPVISSTKVVLKH